MNKQEHQQYRKSRMLELRETIDSCYDEIRIYQAEESMEQNKANIGKCYRYRNSYGGEERWWYYIQITGVNENGSLIGWGFEKDLENEIRIYLCLDHRSLSDNYKEITPEQFWTEWQKIKSELDTLGKAK